MCKWKHLKTGAMPLAPPPPEPAPAQEDFMAPPPPEPAPAQEDFMAPPPPEPAPAQKVFMAPPPPRRLRKVENKIIIIITFIKNTKTLSFSLIFSNSENEKYFLSER